MEPSGASLPRTRTRMETSGLEPLSKMPASPLKIVTYQFVDTPSSSATSSPAAESCTSDAMKPLKPWERTASIDSSVDSSEAGEDDETEEYEGSVVGANCANATTQALRMQTLVRTMQQRLQGLQMLVQEAATQKKPSAQIQSRGTAEGGTNNLKTVPLVDGAKPIDEHETESAGEHEASPGITTLLNRVKTLEAQLKEATDGNQQLQNTVRRLEEENTRLQDRAVSGSTESGRDQESNATDNEKTDDAGISRLASAIFGDPSAFQMAMEEDLAVLKNHERCQHKLHELWETTRTLKTFVETYKVERDAMRIQRDEALAEAGRADAENVKLACSSNPQRKIKYLEQVKKDNQALRRKNRALNVRIAKQAAKFIREKNGCSVLEEEDDETSHDTLDLDGSLLQESDESFCTRNGKEVLHSMRDHRGVLEQQIERLRLARQRIPYDGSDSDSSEESELELAPAATSTR